MLTPRPTWRDYGGFIAGILAISSLFFTWTGLRATDPDISAALTDLSTQEISRNGWETNFFAWFPGIALFAVGTTVLLLGRRPSVRRSGLPQIWLVLASISLLLLGLGWLILATEYGSDQSEFFRQIGVIVEPGFGRYLALAAALLSFISALFDVLIFRREPSPKHPARKNS